MRTVCRDLRRTQHTLAVAHDGSSSASTGAPAPDAAAEPSVATRSELSWAAVGEETAAAATGWTVAHAQGHERGEAALRGLEQSLDALSGGRTIRHGSAADVVHLLRHVQQFAHQSGFCRAAGGCCERDGPTRRRSRRGDVVKKPMGRQQRVSGRWRRAAAKPLLELAEPATVRVHGVERRSRRGVQP